MESDQFLQDEFAWVEEDDRFDLGLCFTLVHSTDVEAVLEVFDSANPRKLRKPTEMGTEEWLDSLADEDTLTMRHAAAVGDWTWILEELSIAAILPRCQNGCPLLSAPASQSSGMSTCCPHSFSHAKASSSVGSNSAG